MNIEKRLKDVAESYRARGFKVVVHPAPEDLPPFAKDFRVEILGTGANGNVLATVKGSPAELEADPNIPRYAERIEQQPGWKFDILVLGPEGGLPKAKRPANESSEQDVQRMLEDAERMVQAGFVSAAFATAWGALEAAMRRRVRASGEEAGWETTPRTLLNELYSSGILSTSVLRALEELFHPWSAVVHGFSAPEVEPGTVRFLVETSRRLLAETPLAKQPA